MNCAGGLQAPAPLIIFEYHSRPNLCHNYSFILQISQLHGTLPTLRCNKRYIGQASGQLINAALMNTDKPVDRPIPVPPNLLQSQNVKIPFQRSFV